MNRFLYLQTLALCGSLAISACSSVNKDWANASAQNTIAAYQSFLNKHSGDAHSQEARSRIVALQDDSTWKTAQNVNSPDGYQQYLQAEPNGTHARAARDEITTLERASAWKTTLSDGTSISFQAFLEKYPQGPEADQARQKLMSIHADYRAELGAFRDKQAAERKLADVKSRFGNVLKEMEVLSPDSSNKRFRVMSGLMDRHDVDSACASLTHDHQKCEVVKDGQVGVG
jgi:hypothetical protein